MAASPRTTIDTTYGVPEHLRQAASPPRMRASRRVRPAIWQRIVSAGALTGITAAVGLALAVSLIGIAVLTLMLLEAAIG